MVIAHTKTLGWQRVDGLVNRGEWFGKTWLVGIGMGFDAALFVVEADHEQDAEIFFCESRFKHLTAVAPEDFDPDYVEYFYNDVGEPHNMENVRILERCEVNYFAPANYFD